ncbi:pyrimidine 5'-nucleotidase [Ferrimonas balearica]|uniref:pyrimidine 5'-nucleotidase n=1 Tax=Ferrimonas balearica TaxID=44012 RepID=UPI001C9A18C0|nr:pyrimidine 5'-nucleotidase [Ferrimonas balearica]MBY5991750.1 pyrimidine 5'-nucleotidase [Ferrimonas balearica]
MSPLLERNVYLFDLDNTLYSPQSGILDQVGQRMRDYVAREFQLSHDEAHAFCQRYYKRYGGTLRGLQLHHPQVDLEAFSQYAHDVELDNLPRVSELADELAAISKRRILFTNSPRPYAERLLDHLGLSHCFEGLFSVEQVDYRMKPHPHAFQTICDHFGFEADSAVMFDDQPDNLSTAKTLGMRTVLVNREDLNDHPACYRTEDLTGFLGALNRP